MPGEPTDHQTTDTRVVLATAAGTPGWPNEDFCAVAPGAAVLLDGATTMPRGTPTGCRHGVAWYARTLGSTLLAALVGEPDTGLADALAAAIGDVRDRHAGTCDLDNPATPAATVTAVRAEPGGFSYLALSDSSIAADYGDGRPPQIVTDDHQPARATPAAAANGQDRDHRPGRPARPGPAQRRRDPDHRSLRPGWLAGSARHHPRAGPARADRRSPRGRGGRRRRHPLAPHARPATTPRSSGGRPPGSGEAGPRPQARPGWRRSRRRRRARRWSQVSGTAQARPPASGRNEGSGAIVAPARLALRAAPQARPRPPPG